MKRKSLLFACLLLLALPFYAAQVDTVMVQSPSMNKEVQVVVVTPDVALGKKAVACPVVYLLHGFGGNAKTWINTKPELPQIADEKGIIFVCPDGKNTWYWDSPKNKDVRYETFISSELVNYIDGHYKTVAAPRGRAITGLSMGGHGALWNAIRHTDVFGAAGSTSGGLDIRPFPHDGVMRDLLGEESENQEIWNRYVAINQIERIKDGDLALIIDCGYDDFFFEVNNDFHKKLLKYNIGHDFLVRPGAHTVDYWYNAIVYQLLFFKNYFDDNNN